MTKKETGGSAFPHDYPSWDEYGPNDTFIKTHNGHQYGVTVRDWFAGKALQGLLAEGRLTADAFEEGVAGVAYSYADAMLKERSK